MKTRFLRNRRCQLRPAYNRSAQPPARFTPRNEREEDYPEIEVIGPGNEQEGAGS
jgi:hypothetical protein